ncbi:MAG: carboxypeptidase-like regulatory domain-containing protein, partial [Planctomycetota bacterium]
DPSATDVRIDFELRAGRVAVGRVVDRDNAPIEGVYVAASGSSSANGAPRSDWETARTGPDGRFVLDTLHPEIAHQIFLQRDGYGTRVYDFPVGERAEDRVDLGTFVLHSGGRIEGTLVGRDGSPVRGHLVKLRGANGDLDRLRPDADPIEKTWVTAVRESRTDTRGRFHFDGLPGGTLRATASVRGRPDARAEAIVELAEGDRVDGVQLRLDLGDVISGRVERPDGAPAPGVFVQVAGPVGGPRIRARSGSGGRFELLGLDDDQGEVELFTIVASYNWYHPDAPLGAGPRTLARPGDAGLVLVLSGLTALSGHVEFPGGDLALDATVTAYPSRAARTKAAALARATCDRGGSFELDLPENCRVDLVVEAPASATDANDGGSDSTSPRTVLEGIASDARGLRIQLVR